MGGKYGHVYTGVTHRARALLDEQFYFCNENSHTKNDVGMGLPHPV